MSPQKLLTEPVWKRNLEKQYNWDGPVDHDAFTAVGGRIFGGEIEGEMGELLSQLNNLWEQFNAQQRNSGGLVS